MLIIIKKLRNEAQGKLHLDKIENKINLK